jgi:hypothetical protein
MLSRFSYVNVQDASVGRPASVKDNVQHIGQINIVHVQRLSG